MNSSILDKIQLKTTNNVVYLVTTRNILGFKGTSKFLVSKIDKTGISGIDIKGAELTEVEFKQAQATNTLLEVFKDKDKIHFIEIFIPWHRVISIKNLIYKHKEA